MYFVSWKKQQCTVRTEILQVGLTVFYFHSVSLSRTYSVGEVFPAAGEVRVWRRGGEAVLSNPGHGAPSALQWLFWRALWRQYLPHQPTVQRECLILTTVHPNIYNLTEMDQPEKFTHCFSHAKLSWLPKDVFGFDLSWNWHFRTLCIRATKWAGKKPTDASRFVSC